MRVEVHLYSQSNSVVIEGARNVYTKDGLYCVMTYEAVYKFPVQHIFRVKEFLVDGGEK